MFKVDDSVLEKVTEIFGRDKPGADEDIATIEKWINEQPHFLETLDRRSILNFLILNKFSVEKAKQKIDNYYTTRTKLEEIYKEMDPKYPHMKEVNEILYYVPHPQLLDYHRVFFMKIRNADLVNKLDVHNLLRYIVSIHEMRMREDVMYKDISIVDFQNVPLTFFFTLTPTFMIKALQMIYQQIYSFRLKAFYIVNFPSFGEMLVRIVQKVVKPKIFERMHIFADTSLLREEFSEEFLPEDFGGKGISLEKLQEMLNDEYDKHSDFFQYLKKFKVDESRRPEKLENDDVLGFYGNFKQLDVD
ncbi:retinol-binding protein pinta-like [Zophobas morio]|uniref:retinol-binding protein pinta-like n=1 Tax=Zophobas morio TaxID=2755281 RepID=UPI003083BA56